MIYLFDEKKNRQLEYGWSEEKLEKYKQFLIPVYTYVDIEKNEDREEIFKEGNTVIIHESFFDNTSVVNPLQIRKKLRDFSTKNKTFNLVFFSGSKNSRKLIDNEASLPVAIMYQNLEIFLKKKAEGHFNLEYLLFGENLALEKELVEKFKAWGANYLKKN